MQMSDNSAVCIDVAADDRDMIRGMCTVAKGRWQNDALCDSSDAIAGCKRSSGTVMWLYRSPKTRNLRDAEASCKDGEIIRPGGS